MSVDMWIDKYSLAESFRDRTGLSPDRATEIVMGLEGELHGGALVAIAKDYPELAREALNSVRMNMQCASGPAERSRIAWGVRNLAMEHVWLRLDGTRILAHEISTRGPHQLGGMIKCMLDIAVPHPEPRKFAAQALIDQLRKINNESTFVSVKSVCSGVLRLHRTDSQVVAPACQVIDGKIKNSWPTMEESVYQLLRRTLMDIRTTGPSAIPQPA